MDFASESGEWHFTDANFNFVTDARKWNFSNTNLNFVYESIKKMGK